ncbi:MAG: LacI family DNA-binding transcriptional regulator [Pseudomonadota bacterium]
MGTRSAENGGRASPKLEDVAKRAGVSISTVSNVINNRTNFSAATKKRVEQAIRDLDYMPDKSGSGLRSSKQWTISLLIRDPTGLFLGDPVLAEIAAGLSQSLNEHGYDLQLKLLSAKSMELRDIFRRRSTDAIIAIAEGLDKERDALLKQLRPLKVPIVLIKQSLPQDYDDVCAIDADEPEASRLLGEHLVARGAQKFAFVSSTPLWHTFELRFRGLQAVLKSLGVSTPIDRIYCDTERFHPAFEAVDAYLARNEAPDVIVGGNDTLAIGAMRAAQSRGLGVPTQVMVAGFNRMDACNFVNPSLTTIESPIRDLGVRSAEMIIERLKSDVFPEKSVTIPVRLQRGEST